MPKTINSAEFRKMIISGARVLEINRAKVDSLNVFPVPDGDTGTNMSLTYNRRSKNSVYARPIVCPNFATRSPRAP